MKKRNNINQAIHLQMEGVNTLKGLFPDSEAVFNKASEIMMLKAGRCICDVPINTFYVRVPDEYKYRCKRCRIVVSPLSITPLNRQHNSLTITIDLVFRFFYSKQRLPFSEIARLYKCSRDSARDKSRRAIDWMELSLRHSNNPAIHKHINDNKVIRAFSAQHDSLTTAVDSLFHALPSLRLAMKNNSLINNQNNKSHANCQS